MLFHVPISQMVSLHPYERVEQIALSIDELLPFWRFCQHLEEPYKNANRPSERQQNYSTIIQIRENFNQLRSKRDSSKLSLPALHDHSGVSFFRVQRMASLLQTEKKKLFRAFHEEIMLKTD